MLESVEAALAASGLSPGLLELEITEPVLLQSNAANGPTLGRLCGMGVGVTMDGFGTGAASLSSLRQFAFDKVKIDRSFVADLASRPDALCIVRAIVGLCRDLSIRTTVKGVETEAQLRILLAERCSELQGFYFGHHAAAGGSRGADRHGRVHSRGTRQTRQAAACRRVAGCGRLERDRLTLT